MPALLRLAAALLATTALSACASVPDRPAASADPASARPGAIYGLYLNGQSALLEGRNADAARFFDQAAAFEAARVLGDRRQRRSKVLTCDRRARLSQEVQLVRARAGLAGTGRAARRRGRRNRRRGGRPDGSGRNR